MQQEQIYNTAIELTKSKRAIDIKRALDLFERIGAYQDAAVQAELCRTRLARLEQYAEHPVPPAKKSIGAIVAAIACLLVLCFAVGIFASYLPDGEGHPTHTPDSLLAGTADPTEYSTNDLIWTEEPDSSSPSWTHAYTSTPGPVSASKTATATQATPTPTPTTATPIQYALLSEQVTLGSIVQYGSYEQDNILSNGAEPIEWIVIDKQGDKALLLSRCGLDAIPFHERLSSITWADCSLRNWLNTTFYETAFTESQQVKIQTTLITESDPHPLFGEYFTAVEPTNDRLFVLSYNEYVQYDARVDITKTLVTAYAEANGAYCTADGIPSSPGWWLRSPYERDTQAMVIDDFKQEEGFSPVHGEFRTVRPAMWVQLDASLNASATPTTLANPTPSAGGTPIPANVSIGDRVQFGTYEQDGDFANGQESISWIVLDKQDGKALLLSLYGLDRQPFDSSDEEAIWENSTLRNWLNTTFLEKAFSTSLQPYIVNTTLKNEANPDTANGVDDRETMDKVFLLSYNEAKQYFKRSTDDDLLNVPVTAYTKSLGSAWENEYQENYWWLRTSGSAPRGTVVVYPNGSIYGAGASIFNNNMVVRPAIWVTLA